MNSKENLEKSDRNPIESVVFDWGGVLIDDPVPGFLAFIEVHFPRFGVREFDEEAMVDFQKGTISEMEFWSRIGLENIEMNSLFQGSLWRSAFESTYAERAPVFAIAKQLQLKGITTAVLSNTEKPSVEMFQSKGYTCFDETYFSCDWGMVKPESVIYQRCIDSLGYPSDRILFIDDKPENIEAAKRAGMQGHVMKDISGLKDCLNLWGLGF